MFARLPSPAALRTFEAAARLGSFKRAAEELSVTPAAVSHQIRTLESLVGTALFVRNTRAVQLTKQGERLAPALHSAFLLMRDAVEDIQAAETVLTISTTPAFAALRLVPRLPEFYAAHPGVTVQIEASTAAVDLRRDRRVDVAIRYGVGPYQGLHAVPLMGEQFGVYCAPTAVDRFSDPRASPLFETGWREQVLQDVSWAHWLAAAGIDLSAARPRVTTFPEEHYVLQAAVAGQGLALASSVLAHDFVVAGLLVLRHPEIALDGNGYTMLCTSDRVQASKTRRFLEWAATALSR